MHTDSVWHIALIALLAVIVAKFLASRVSALSPIAGLL